MRFSFLLHQPQVIFWLHVVLVLFGLLVAAMRVLAGCEFCCLLFGHHSLSFFKCVLDYTVQQDAEYNIMNLSISTVTTS
jgi:hypothetical protein